MALWIRNNYHHKLIPYISNEDIITSRKGNTMNNKGGRFFSLIVLLLCIFSLTCTNPIKNDENQNLPHVHLVGKVLTKDGNPVPYAIAHLEKFDVYDTTDNNGKYEIVIDSSDTGILFAKSTADSSDSLTILKDGQIITSIEIIDYIDTLPDVIIVQRDIHGKIIETVTLFSRIEAVLWNQADTIQTIAELFYSKPTFSYSGFVYFVYTGSKQDYSIYVNVFNTDSQFIGRSDTIDFTSIAGDIEIPLINPLNATPSVNASADSAIGIKDTFVLSGTASDNYGGEIISWSWDVGNKGDFIATTPDSNLVTVAPSEADDSYECVLRVMDDDSNIVFDTVSIAVETRAPIADAGADTTVGINDSVNLRGSASHDESKIVEYAWKTGAADWFTVSTGDTTIAAPATAQAWVCSLQVTDDDGTTTYDAITVTVETRAPKVVAAGDTAIFVNEQVNLYGSGSYDETEIVDFSWKIGDSNWASVTTGDTTITAPATEQILVCSLRVTDNDGNIDIGEVTVITVAHSIFDADGNTYTVIKIGNQFWTVENLRTTTYNDNTVIPHVTDATEWAHLSTPGYCFYDNSTDPAAQEKWGALYNWDAVNTGKLAPEGWRVPTNAEWDTLQNYLIANGYNWDGSTTGDKIAKSMAAQTDWPSSTAAGTIGNDLSKNNASGFSAFPGGCRGDFGDFLAQSNDGLWWSATENDASNAWYRDLYYDYENLIRNYEMKRCGFSVRLLRD